MRFAVLLLCLLAACGGSERSDDGDDDAPADDIAGDASTDAGDDDSIDGTGLDGQPANPGVFSPGVTDVVVEIDYEQGHAPYTGLILGFGDTFDTTVTNLDRLFGGRKALTIPVTEATMQNVGVIGDEELTVEDLLALAAQHRQQQDTATTKTYYVIFVSGYFTDMTGPRPTVLGISLGNTGVLVMFKDVIRSTDVLGFPNVVRYVEQSTLVHELAHAIGLVNNGVPLTMDHQDEPHGAHCTNERCVMYYQNEGASEATEFAMTYVLTGNTVLFDDACLQDVDALSGGPLP